MMDNKALKKLIAGFAEMGIILSRYNRGQTKKRSHSKRPAKDEVRSRLYIYDQLVTQGQIYNLENIIVINNDLVFEAAIYVY